MKLGVIGIIILVVFVLIVAFFINQEFQHPCEKEPKGYIGSTATPRADCYLKDAVSSNNKELCIDNNKVKKQEACLIQIALKMNEVSYCDYLKEYERIIYEKQAERKDYNYPDPISMYWFTATCYSEISKAKIDTSVCSKIPLSEIDEAFRKNRPDLTKESYDYSSKAYRIYRSCEEGNYSARYPNLEFPRLNN